MSDKPSITVTLGYTLNLGNFQSLRVDIGFSDFIRDNEDNNSALDRIYKFVEDKVIEKVDEAKKELD